MSFVNIDRKPPGTIVKMQTSAIVGGLMTYVVFVQGHTAGGKRPVATWHADDLERTGRMLTLDEIRGYDFIMRGILSADASMNATLSYDGVADPVDNLTLLLSEGKAFERRWSIVVR